MRSVGGFLQLNGRVGSEQAQNLLIAVESSARIPVALERNPYEVLIERHGLNRLGDELLRSGVKTGRKILIVSNRDVAGPYGEQCIDALRSAGFDPSLLVIEAGEERKNLATIQQIYDEAFRLRLERSSLFVALGGGVVGDMTGFAAATWLRGLAVVQVPTTLLAMVDAAIGGKTGVNHPGGKNLIGAFHQPKLVLIDPSTLASLPEREFRAGMAEVIKYGVIGDADLFAQLEQGGKLSSVEEMDPSLLQTTLERSAQAKARVVAADEREGGLRAILNYGHTFGHVVENLTGYGTWLHGEAVAIGMVAAGELAVQRNLWSREDCDRQRRLIAQAGLPTAWPTLNPTAVLDTLTGDKKVQDGKVRFVLPKALGSVTIVNDVEQREILDCLSSLTEEAAL